MPNSRTCFPDQKGDQESSRTCLDDQKALEVLSSPIARIPMRQNSSTCWDDQHENRMPSAKIEEPINAGRTIRSTEFTDKKISPV